MFKKIILISVCLLMVCTTVGCGKGNNKDDFKVDANDFNLDFSTQSNEPSADDTNQDNSQDSISTDTNSSVDDTIAVNSSEKETASSNKNNISVTDKNNSSTIKPNSSVSGTVSKSESNKKENAQNTNSKNNNNKFESNKTTNSQNTNSKNNTSKFESDKTTNSQNASSNNKTSSATSSKVYIESPTVDNTSSITSEQEKPQNATSVELPSYENTYKLSNSLNILKSGETLKVVYYGGSVTAGTGSKDAEKKSWRALTDSFLKTYGNVNSVNKSVGGTGSYLGISRFEKDVIAENPDLLFIECAINDGYSGLSSEVSVKDVEYMIRKLNAHNPKADIVICFITDKSNFGKKYSRYVAQKELADYYSIPCIDLGGGLYNYLKGKSNRFLEFFTDSVHPNDRGYSVYADVAKEALTKLLIEGESTNHSLPSFKSKNGWSEVSVLKVDSFAPLKLENIGKDLWGLNSYNSNETYEKTGSQLKTSQTVKNHFKNYLYPKTNNSSFTFSFKGNSLGFIGTIKEGCSLTAVLEDGKTVTLTGVSKAELIEYPIFSDIENKDHTVTISVSGKPPYITIASFIVTE